MTDKCKRCGCEIKEGVKRWFHTDGCEHFSQNDCIDALTARLAEAEERIQALREAIKPFAEFAKLLDDFDDEHSVIRRKDWLVSDHRKALQAYGED